MSSNEPKIIEADEKIPKHVKYDSVDDKIIMGGCPLVPHKMISVNKCIKCEYHDGFAKVSHSKSFIHSHRVMCCHAVLKEMREIE